MNVKVLFLVLSFTFGGFAFGQTKVDKRQRKQKARIVNGVKSGELTAKETKQLTKQQAKIRRMERNAKKDGVVTAKEKARIQKAQNRASRNIKRKKNNKIER
ncbi:MAG: hypothetical protein ACPGU6_01450 [Tenacibaculum sp.]